MIDVSVTDAKARFREIVNRVEAGETLRITRRGKAVVELRAIENPRPPIDFDAIREARESMPLGEDSVDRIRRMRDDL